MVHSIYVSEKDKEQLAKVSIDPFTQKDDFFDYSKVVITKPWGYEYLLARTPDVAVWALYIASGKGTSLHCHPNKKTSIVTLSGKAECSTLTSAHQLEAGEGLLLEQGVFHSTRAVSADAIMVLETETPTNKRDLVRLSDTYGRMGQGYEGSTCYTDLDGSMHCHFHGSEEEVPKTIGACHVAIVHHKRPVSFAVAFSSPGIIAVLAGGIKGGLLFQAGDIFSGIQIKETDRDTTIAEGVFLTITKL